METPFILIRPQKKSQKKKKSMILLLYLISLCQELNKIDISKKKKNLFLEKKFSRKLRKFSRRVCGQISQSGVTESGSGGGIISVFCPFPKYFQFLQKYFQCVSQSPASDASSGTLWHTMLITFLRFSCLRFRYREFEFRILLIYFQFYDIEAALLPFCCSSFECIRISLMWYILKETDRWQCKCKQKCLRGWYFVDTFCLRRRYKKNESCEWLLPVNKSKIRRAF